MMTAPYTASELHAAPVLRAAPSAVPGGVLAFMPVFIGSADASPDVQSMLDPSELELAMAMSPHRRDAFVAGRVALRAALHAVDPAFAMQPLLRTPRGAPSTPVGAAGSVSHKRTRAVALAAPLEEAHVGVDLETRPQESDPIRSSERRRALATRILTAHELSGIDALDAHAHRQATLLYFALKEAVYKCIDPFVERYVRFTEVDIAFDMGGLMEPHASGSATVTLRLPECERMPLQVQAAWMLEPSWIVTTALGRRA